MTKVFRTFVHMQPQPISELSNYESLLLGSVKASYPAPGGDAPEKLDLVKTLVPNRTSTFFFRVDGVSMVDADMDEGDIIIVDRAVDPYNDCKAVCFLNGEFTVKRVDMTSGGIVLVPCNENNTIYKPISVSPDDEFTIWGVITWVIKKA